MRFIVDECVGPTVASWLEDEGHNVVCISHSGRGSEDSVILSRSIEEKRVVITNDRDFGDLVFRDLRSHCGIILIRSEDETSANKIRCLKYCFDHISEDLSTLFIVISEKTSRISIRTRKI